MNNDYNSREVGIMVLKLLFTQWIYFVLTMTSINSYVFFAADLDDFRTIAKKIIPGQLADQLADMASQNANSPQGYEEENINTEDKDNYEDSAYSDDLLKNNNDAGDKSKIKVYRDSEQSDLDTYKPLYIKSKPSVPRKRYIIKNHRFDNEKHDNINIDDLVERVKDKLAKEFKIASKDHNIEKLTDPTEDTDKKIEDYYYKDEALNEGLTKYYDYPDSVKLEKTSQVFTTERHHKPGFSLNGVNAKDLQHDQDKNAKKAQKHSLNDPKSVKYDEEFMKEVVEYDEATVKDTHYYSKGNAGEMKSNTGSNFDQAGDYEGTYLKDIPEYYEGEEKDSIQNNKKSIKKLASYNSNIVKKKSAKNMKYLNNDNNVKEIAVYDGKTVKNVPAYYEDDAKEIVQTEVGSVKDIAEIDDEVKDVPEYYEDDLKESQPTAGPADIFKEVDMLKKTDDSYEDYVTPKRDNIFESTEEQTLKPFESKNIQKFAAVNNLKFKLNKPKAFADPVIKNKVISYVPMASLAVPSVSQPLKRIVKKKPDEVKGKTESMWYKDPNIENYDDSTKKTTPGAGNNTTKKRLNTMFPTKAHFKMSSPNYYAKLPAVVEKYNFNEPLPEKDREPENLKHFGNPPAKINKKVNI